MNTLGKAITSSFYANPETGFTELKRVWKEAGLHRSPDGAVHLLYMILRGRDYRKAFTAPTNANKVANGGLEQWAAKHHVRAIRRFGVVPEVAQRLGGAFLAHDCAARIAHLLPPPKHGAKTLEPYCGPARVEMEEVAG